MERMSVLTHVLGQMAIHTITTHFQEITIQTLAKSPQAILKHILKITIIGVVLIILRDQQHLTIPLQILRVTVRMLQLP